MVVAIGNISFSHPESDERQQPPSTSLATQAEARTKALAPARFQLVAATSDDFRRELTSCLVLCAPSGMSGDDRKEWLQVAWGTLRDIPPDLLTIGCAAARRRADHPSKIVPAIMEEIRGDWERRKVRRFEATRYWDDRDRRGQTHVEVATPAQIAAIKDEIGLVTQPYKEVAAARGAPRKPTRQDYIDLGVDSAFLDES